MRKRKYPDDVQSQHQHLPCTPVKSAHMDVLVTPPGQSYYKRARVDPLSPPNLNSYLGSPVTPRQKRASLPIAGTLSMSSSNLGLSNERNNSNLSTPPSSSKCSPELSNAKLFSSPKILPNVTNRGVGNSNYYGDTCYSFNLNGSSLDKRQQSNVRVANWRDACHEKMKHEQNKVFKRFQQECASRTQDQQQEQHSSGSLRLPSLSQCDVFPQSNKLSNFINNQYSMNGSLVNYPFVTNTNEYINGQADIGKLVERLPKKITPNGAKMPLISTNTPGISLPPIGEIFSIAALDKSVLHPMGLTIPEHYQLRDMDRHSVTFNADPKQYFYNNYPKQFDYEPISNISKIKRDITNMERIPTKFDFAKQDDEDDGEADETTDFADVSLHQINIIRQNREISPNGSPSIYHQQYEEEEEIKLPPLVLPKQKKKTIKKKSSYINKEYSKVSKRSRSPSRKSSFNSRGRPVLSGNRPRTRSSSRGSVKSVAGDESSLTSSPVQLQLQQSSSSTLKSPSSPSSNKVENPSMTSNESLSSLHHQQHQLKMPISTPVQMPVPIHLNNSTDSVTHGLLNHGNTGQRQQPQSYHAAQNSGPLYQGSVNNIIHNHHHVMSKALHVPALQQQQLPQQQFYGPATTTNNNYYGRSNNTASGFNNTTAVHHNNNQPNFANHDNNKISITNNNSNGKKCLSCNTTNSPCWRPSWDTSKGQLCNSCGLRYRKSKARCMNDSCLLIPSKGEWGLIQRRGKFVFSADRELYKCLQCDHAMEVKG